MQTDFRAPACRLSHKAWPIHSGLSKTVRLQPKFSKSFAAVSGWMWMFTVTRCARHPWHPVATDFALGNLLLSCLTGITRLSVTLKKSEKYENMLHIVASCCINSASRYVRIYLSNEQSCGHRGFKLESARRKNCWLHLAMVKESRISRLDFEVACKVSTCFNFQHVSTVSCFFPLICGVHHFVSCNM